MLNKIKTILFSMLFCSVFITNLFSSSDLNLSSLKLEEQKIDSELKNETSTISEKLDKELDNEILKSGNKIYSTSEEFFSALNFYQKNIKDNSNLDKVLEPLKMVSKTVENDIEIEKILIKNIIKNILERREILNNDFTKELNDLKLKSRINTKNGNKLATARDTLLLETYNNRIIFINTINNLKNLYYSYQKKEIIEAFLDDSIKLFDDKKILIFKELYDKNNIVDANKTNETNEKNSISEKFLENYKLASFELDYFKFSLHYLKNNSELISRENQFVKQFNFANIVKYIDKNSSLQDLNYYLEYYFKTTFGLIIIGFIIFILINIIYLMIKVFLNSVSKPILKNQSLELKNYVNIVINKHLFLIIFLFSIDIFLKVFNYRNTNYDNSYFQLIYVFSFVYIGYIFINELIVIFSEKFFEKYPNVKKEMVAFLLKTIKGILFIITFLIVLSKLGFDTKALLASLGVGGIAVALAAKDTLSNLFGSIIIMLDNSFSQGDLIVTEKYEGTVVEIRMRTTTIRTFDNALVTIPNINLANTEIKNFTKRKVGRMIKVIVGVTYDSDMENIKKFIEDIKENINNNENISKEENLQIDTIRQNYLLQAEDALGIKKDVAVALDSYGDSSINILIQCFSTSVKWTDWINTKEELLFEINTLLKKNNLDFAYPTVVNKIMKAK